jgi:hypothetical protein
MRMDYVFVNKNFNQEFLKILHLFKLLKIFYLFFLDHSSTEWFTTQNSPRAVFF